MLNTNRLIELRKKTNMTQAQVAERLNTSRPNYVRYERGNHQPPNEVLGAMAELFSVSIDYLLDKTDDPAPKNKKKEPLSLEEIEALYMQALIDSKIKEPDKPLTPEARKKLEDSIRLAVRIAIETQGD